jgi:hypothetical protein
MFKREHHQRIARLLNKLDAERLREADCFFGGGTAIVLLAGEYRESVDIDFVCSSAQGYRMLREIVFLGSLDGLSKEPLRQARELRKERDKIYTLIDDGLGLPPLKLEIVREARIEVAGEFVPELPVPVLTRTDLYAEKLLANADRWDDPSVLYRDAIDLAMMVNAWGEIPAEAVAKARGTYGADAVGSLARVTAYLAERPHKLANSLHVMGMDQDLAARIVDLLQGETARLTGTPRPTGVPASPAPDCEP